MRFQIINNRSFAENIISFLNEKEYKEVINPYTGGDDDFLIIDAENKEYSWFEQGFPPYYSDIPHLESKNITEIQELRFGLKDIIKEANNIFNNENIRWDEKFDLIFSDDIAQKIYSIIPDFTWHDPDGSHREDVTAFINALNEYFTKKCR